MAGCPPGFIALIICRVVLSTKRHPVDPAWGFVPTKPCISNGSLRSLQNPALLSGSSCIVIDDGPDLPGSIVYAAAGMGPPSVHWYCGSFCISPRVPEYTIVLTIKSPFAFVHVSRFEEIEYMHCPGTKPVTSLASVGAFPT